MSLLPPPKSPPLDLCTGEEKDFQLKPHDPRIPFSLSDWLPTTRSARSQYVARLTFNLKVPKQTIGPEQI